MCARETSNTCVPGDLCKNIPQALIKITKILEIVQIPNDQKRTNKLWYTNIMDYCRALKMNEQ